MYQLLLFYFQVDWKGPHAWDGGLLGEILSKWPTQFIFNWRMCLIWLDLNLRGKIRFFPPTVYGIFYSVGWGTFVTSECKLVNSHDFRVFKFVFNFCIAGWVYLNQLAFFLKCLITFFRIYGGSFRSSGFLGGDFFIRRWISETLDIYLHLISKYTLTPFGKLCM